MKNCKILNNITLYILIICSVSCNDDYLEKYPLDSLTNETFWQSEQDLKAFTSGFYTIFGGQTVWHDDKSDNQATASYNEVVAGQHTVDKGTWSWSYLRKCNFFLKNYNKSGQIPEEISNIYKGEVLFFRAMFTYGRIKSYGDIPFTTKVLSNNDTDELYAPRTDRKVVMKQVIEDINNAVNYIPTSRDEEGRLTKWVALALKARICLHEGTFRKYHKLGDHKVYLEAARDASKEIIDSDKFKLYTTGKPNEDYRNLFIKLDLSDNKEAIFFEKYVSGVKGHNFIRYMTESHKDGLTKDMVNDYLCTDGKPIGNSSLYLGDNTLSDEFSNRDPRLLQTIVRPGGKFFSETSELEIVPRLPYAKGAGSATTTGYHIIKMYSNDEVGKYAQAETDLFLFRYAETLLIYAESMAELGLATQAVIDITINKIRARAGMPNMVIAALVRDPQSDMTTSAGYLDEEVSVLLEEIRRERRIELACEGFRYDDLMRWRAGKFLTKTTLGAKWEAFKNLKNTKDELIYDHVVVGTDIHINSEGYIDLYKTQLPSGKVFDPNKHYYYGIPLGEISLNPNLKQNPGWD